VDHTSSLGDATAHSSTGASPIVFFFRFVCYGWLLFRASSFEQIALFTQTLLGFGPSGVASVIPRPPLPALLGMALLTVLQLLEHLQGRNEAVLRWPRPVQGAVLATIFIILVMGCSNPPAQFIYFQF
jgi:hypothetical protein